MGKTIANSEDNIDPQKRVVYSGTVYDLDQLKKDKNYRETPWFVMWGPVKGNGKRKKMVHKNDVGFFN